MRDARTLFFNIFFAIFLVNIACIINKFRRWAHGTARSNQTNRHQKAIPSNESKCDTLSFFSLASRSAWINFILDRRNWKLDTWYWSRFENQWKLMQISDFFHGLILLSTQLLKRQIALKNIINNNELGVDDWNSLRRN